MSADDEKCRACGARTRDAFCRRCWRLAPVFGRAELAWWLGEFRSAGDTEAARFAYAAWSITAAWLAELIRAELEKRQGRRVARRHGARKRAKSLKELADEADARA